MMSEDGRNVLGKILLTFLVSLYLFYFSCYFPGFF